MKVHEDNANKGDLFTTAARPYGDDDDNTDKPNGAVIDLVLPVIVLIICCIIGMIYSGGFFTGESFVDAFAGADAPKGWYSAAWQPSSLPSASTWCAT